MEVALPLSDAMAAIYGAIGELMAGCIKELRASNKVDASELTLEGGLLRSFDDIVRRQLDAVWHTVSFRTKQARAVANPDVLWIGNAQQLPLPVACCVISCQLQHHAGAPWLAFCAGFTAVRRYESRERDVSSPHFDTRPSLQATAQRPSVVCVRLTSDCLWSAQVVTDLGVLRELAEGLLRYDAVTFLQLLDTLRQSEGRAAVWLLHTAAHTVFDYVRSRVAAGPWPHPCLAAALAAQLAACSEACPAGHASISHGSLLPQVHTIVAAARAFEP